MLLRKTNRDKVVCSETQPSQVVRCTPVQGRLSAISRFPDLPEPGEQVRLRQDRKRLETIQDVQYHAIRTAGSTVIHAWPSLARSKRVLVHSPNAALCDDVVRRNNQVASPRSCDRR